MGKYVGTVEKGLTMLFNPRPGNPLEATVCAAVAFRQRGKPDRIVQRGQRYIEGDEPKGLQGRADRMAEKWNAYLKRTGKRWELEQDEKRNAKVAKLKAERAKRRALMEAAPAFRVALHTLVHAIRFDGDVSRAMQDADALLADHPVK